MNLDTLYTYDEMAQRLRVARSTLENAVSNGHLHPQRIGTLVRFTDSDVSEWIQAGGKTRKAS